MKRVSQADTVAWVHAVLSGQTQETAHAPQPDSLTSHFIREALGEPQPVVPLSLRQRALVVLLEAEQERRRALKQQGNN